MRIRTVAVVAVVALIVGSTAAYAISGSSWEGSGTVRATIKIKGRKPVKAFGTFDGTLDVFSSTVVTHYPVVTLETGSRFEPVSTTTPAIFTSYAPVDTISEKMAKLEKTGGDVQSLVIETLDNFLPPVVSSPPLYLTSTLSSYQFPDPPVPTTTPALVFDTPGATSRGSYKATKNFTRVKGKNTLKVHAIYFEEDGTPRLTTITIKATYDGMRVF